MSADYGIFNKLLTIDELYELYGQIGESVLSYLDIKNINKDIESTYNSIQLLIETSLIACDAETKMHFKQTIILNRASFIEELYKKLLEKYLDAFSFVDKDELRYDEAEAKYYIKRNYVVLSLSGLIMLLNGMGVIKIKENNVYFLDKDLLRIYRNEVQHTKRKTSLVELLKQLQMQEEFGNDAELAAIEYEKRLLMNNDIHKEPERVSLYDVKAGYDIVSYMTSNSNVPDKFIEVKSCANEYLHFYISRNEIETAKSKNDHYYLYLLNRKTNKFTIISNPYEIFFASGEMRNWAIEPQVFQIHQLEK